MSLRAIRTAIKLHSSASLNLQSVIVLSRDGEITSLRMTLRRFLVEYREKNLFSSAAISSRDLIFANERMNEDLETIRSCSAV